jgi:hypothetical protein
VATEDVLAVDAIFAAPGIEEQIPEPQRLPVVHVKMGVMVVVKPRRRLPGQEGREVDSGVIEERDHVVIKEREHDAPRRNRKQKQRRRGDRLVNGKLDLSPTAW